MKFGENISKALFTALFISLLNILIGFAAGVALAYRNLKEGHKKVIGISAFTALLMAAAAINLYVATKRSSQVDDLSMADMASIMNLMAFCVGFLFACFAAWKGYWVQGTYPGYKAASAAYLMAKKTIRDTTDRLRELISKEVRDEEDLRKTCVRRAGEVVTHMEAIKGQLTTLQASYSAGTKHLSSVLENAVGEYRQTNIATKGVAATSPDWFDEAVEPLPEASETIAGAQVSLEVIHSEARKVREGQSDISAEEIAAIQSLKTTFLGERLTGLLEETEASGIRRYQEQLDTVGNFGRSVV